MANRSCAPASPCTTPVADFTNHVGGLPVRNFSSGQLVADKTAFKLGGNHIRERNLARGGQTAHACMPGCLIECSNVYVDEHGKEIVSPPDLPSVTTSCPISSTPKHWRPRARQHAITATRSIYACASLLRVSYVQDGIWIGDSDTASASSGA